MTRTIFMGSGSIVVQVPTCRKHLARRPFTADACITLILAGL